MTVIVRLIPEPRTSFQCYLCCFQSPITPSKSTSQQICAEKWEMLQVCRQLFAIFLCAGFLWCLKKIHYHFFPLNARACMFVSNLFLCYYQSQGNGPVNKQMYGCFSIFCLQWLTNSSLVLFFLFSLFHLMSEISITWENAKHPEFGAQYCFFVKLIYGTMATDNDNTIWSISSKVCFPP